MVSDDEIPDGVEVDVVFDRPSVPKSMLRCQFFESGPFTAVPIPVAEHEALMAVLAGARALRARGGTATALFAAVDAYDEAHGKETT